MTTPNPQKMAKTEQAEDDTLITHVPGEADTVRTTIPSNSTQPSAKADSNTQITHLPSEADTVHTTAPNSLANSNSNLNEETHITEIPGESETVKTATPQGKRELPSTTQANEAETQITEVPYESSTVHTAVSTDQQDKVQTVIAATQIDSTDEGQRAARNLEAIPSLPGYLNQRILGRGGMGIIIHAYDERLKRSVAIKFPLQQHSFDNDLRTRFLREAQSVAALRHAHICPIYDYGEQDGQLFLILPFIEGITLDKWLKENNPAARDLAEMMAKISDAVACAHNAHIIHRDLKPANIIIDSVSNEPILMDFGLAKNLKDEQASLLTQDGQILGTPAYMSPEQANASHIVDERSDIYSLGALLYEMLCKQAPYTGSINEILTKLNQHKPLLPKKINTQVHPDLETICLKAMHRERKERYNTAQELSDDLRRFASGEAILARRPGVIKRFILFIKRHPITFAGANIAFIIILIIGGIAISQKERNHTRNQLQIELSQFDPSKLQDKSTRKIFYDRIEEFKLLDTVAAQTLQLNFADKLTQSFLKIIDKARLNISDKNQLNDLLNEIKILNPSLHTELQAKLLDRLEQWDLVGEYSNQDYQDALRLVANQKSQRHNKFYLNTKISTPISYKIDCSWTQKNTNIDSFSIFIADKKRKDRHFYSFSLEQLRDNSFRPDAWSLVLRRRGAIQGAWLIANDNNDLNKLNTHEKFSLHVHYHNGHFTMRFNNKNYEYRDHFAQVSHDSEFILSGYKNIELIHFNIRSKEQSRNPSPLEQGDFHYAQGQWEEARQAYTRQLEREQDDDIKAETRYKLGLTFLAFNKHEQAEKILSQLMNDQKGEWSSLAGSQLWAHFLKTHQYEAADAVFAFLDLSFHQSDLSTILPYELRLEIQNHYRNTATSHSLLLPDPKRLEGIENLIRIQSFLSNDPQIMCYVYFQHIRALHWYGKLNEARNHCEQYLLNHSKDSDKWMSHIVADYSWLLRLDNKPELAIEMMDDFKEIVYLDSPYFIVFAAEYARCLLKLGKTEEAKAHLHENIKTLNKLKYHNYTVWSELHFLLAAITDDIDEKQRLEQEGCPSHWSKSSSEKEILKNGFNYLSIIYSFQFESDKNIKAFQNLMFNLENGRHGDGKTISAVIRNLNLNNRSMSTAWDFPRSKEIANEFIFRTQPFQVTTRDMLCLIANQEIKQRLFPSGISEVEADLLWDISRQTFNAYQTQELSTNTLFGLALTYKGIGAEFAWNSVADRMPQALRPRLAYLFSLRFKQLKNDELSQLLLNEAIQNSENDKLLKAVINSHP